MSLPTGLRLLVCVLAFSGALSINTVKYQFFGCSVSHHCAPGMMKVKVMAHAPPYDSGNADNIHEVPWAFGTLPFQTDNNILHLQGGATVRFVSTGGKHDVYEFVDEQHYDTCDFTGATEVHQKESKAFVADIVIEDDGYTEDDVHRR